MGLLTSCACVDAACILIGLITLAYLVVKYYFSYWERKGFKSLKPSFPFGNFAKSFLLKRSAGEVAMDIYNNTDEPFIGTYATFRPILLVRDPELIRDIMIKDFSHFTDRGVYIDEKRNPLSAHLFALPGQKWKNLRGKLSPTFTSGKLKAMISTLINCGAALEKYLQKAANEKATIAVRELSASHSTNVIASVAFGIDVDSIENPNTDFRKYGRKVFAPTAKNGIRALFNFVCPALMKFLRLRTVDEDVEDFVFSVVKQNLDYREQNNVVRKDFFQLLIQLRNTGTVQLDDQWETVIKSDEQQKTLTLNEVAAQAFVFFLAGFETSATTLSYCLFEIAKNPEIQRKVHAEIDEILKKHNGEITYESVSEMKYLERCIDETLRKYPPVPILNRECTADYNIPGTNLTIEKGTQVFIPALALHRDDKYYPEPEKFIPERFSEENTLGKSFVNRPYIPFGEGPRICIGLRLGKMQTKVGLVLMLQRFQYQLQGGQGELVISPKQFILAPVSGINLQVSNREGQ